MSVQMPHAETVRIMEIMDGLRKSWGYEIGSVLDSNKYVIISDKTNVHTDSKTKTPMRQHRGFLRSSRKCQERFKNFDSVSCLLRLHEFSYRLKIQSKKSVCI